jgi:hypothetical protein
MSIAADYSARKAVRRAIEASLAEPTLPTLERSNAVTSTVHRFLLLFLLLAVGGIAMITSFFSDWITSRLVRIVSLPAYTHQLGEAFNSHLLVFRTYLVFAGILVSPLLVRALMARVVDAPFQLGPWASSGYRTPAALLPLSLAICLFFFVFELPLGDASFSFFRGILGDENYLFFLLTVSASGVLFFAGCLALLVVQMTVSGARRVDAT